jgi:hypothetical protein
MSATPARSGGRQRSSMSMIEHEGPHGYASDEAYERALTRIDYLKRHPVRIPLASASFGRGAASGD